MSTYLIRLDDACPQMDSNKWAKMEKLLDSFDIQPIVGVIPDNQDTDFSGKILPSDFWNIVHAWQDKKWTIAMHGLHHKLDKHEPRGYFQKSHSIKTEWAGVPYDTQVEMLQKGLKLLASNGITPTCFFAPCHTYDINTVRALTAVDENIWISDGYALQPYKKNGVWFMPSLFDTAHKLPFYGVYTFVYHPNNMTDADFKALQDFLVEYRNDFKNAEDVLQLARKKNNEQGIVGFSFENAIYVIRGIKRLVRN